jgi:UDP-N-acetylmuramoylalanine--D-glutamate ligase
MSAEMVRHELSAREPSLDGLRVLVIGLGRSGLAAARLAGARGAEVTVADRREADELELAGAAREAGVRVRAGGHPPSLAAEADLVVVSPGVPTEIEVLGEARRRGLPVWGEIELAARFCRGRVIGITGSNGKSTVTSMTGRILRGAGVPGGTGGNLDTPFCELLADDGPDAVHALELSSFQLETVESFSPLVAAILNLSPDHLDRYDSYDDYARAKARILEIQQEEAFAVLNADDAPSERFRSSVRGRLHEFSTRHEVERGAFLRRGRLVLRAGGGDVELLEAARLPVPGEHNLANALAAALACALAGCPAGAIAEGLEGYRALSHRLEHVRTLRGVEFYNDSKATNPAAAAEALGSFEAGKVRLILGGKDKGADWTGFLELVRRRARQTLLVGQATAMLAPLLAGAEGVVECGTVGNAVKTAFAAAEAGDVVLLSPACASFDQYRSFEERGEDFRRAVDALTDTGADDA